MVSATNRSPDQIFDMLINVMEVDNGFIQFGVTPEHRQRSLPAIYELQQAGYFFDDPTDLEGSFWMAGAGERDEAPEFFDLAPDAFDKLSAVLNDIFNGE